MDRRWWVTAKAGVIGIAYFWTVASVGLAQSVHVAEALQHVQAAIAQGDQGYPDALATHAREALKFAELAKKETPNPHLDEGIQALKQALDEAKGGKTEAATKAAKEALHHLSQVNPATAGAAAGDSY